MGQYYLVVNLDKQEFLHAHKFGDGLKLMEFGSSGQGTMMGLAVLLADGNGRGGGDFRGEDTSYVGRWKGDRIVIAGDYADPGTFLPSKDKRKLQKAAKEQFAEGYQDPAKVNLYGYAQAMFRDISDDVCKMLVAAGEMTAPTR